jgi:NNP family nitrate/nitrite transporter-like MFS transporter
MAVSEPPQEGDHDPDHRTPPIAQATGLAVPARRTGRWIDDWRPEEPEFWAETGQQVARRNLIWSIFAEHLGFSVWLIWSVSSAFLLSVGFAYTLQQLFVLVALPNLVGSLLRLPYTLAVPKFGGRNFASSMANIDFFYPSAKKGAALGLNAAGGNLGVSLIQFFLPVIGGGAGIFGIVKASDGAVHLERAAWVYPGLAVVATLAAYFFMDHLGTATWIMAFLYIGTFGSFIGYSAAMPLLIKLNFWVAEPAPLGTGLYFAYFAFLGALVGSMTRPLGGWLADKYGGAKVTLAAFGGMVVFTLAVPWTLTQLTPDPTADPGIASDNQSWFPWLPGFFLCVFASTGIGNGSTYKMIPAIWRTEAERATEPGTPQRAAALLAATKQASAAIGVIGAVGAIGGFLIPIAFSSPCDSSCTTSARPTASSAPRPGWTASRAAWSGSARSSWTTPSASAASSRPRWSTTSRATSTSGAPPPRTAGDPRPAHHLPGGAGPTGAGESAGPVVLGATIPVGAPR